MDLGDFANYRQNNQNAENARREAERQRAEIEKLLHEQKRTNDLLQSQEAEKQLQSKLYELTSYLEVKYSQLLTENNTGETFNAAKEFLNNHQNFLNIADHENYSNLEYKKLASETRSRIDLILEKAVTIVLRGALEEIKSDLESINTSPTEELALHLAKKYEGYKIIQTPRISTYKGETPESLGKKSILDDHFLISSHHKQLAEKAQSSIEMIRQNDWFIWGVNEQEIETNNRTREQKKRDWNSGGKQFIEAQENKRKETIWFGIPAWGGITGICLYLLFFTEACNSDPVIGWGCMIISLFIFVYLLQDIFSD